MPNIHIDTRQFSGVDPGLEPDDGSVWFWPYRPYVEDSALVSKQIVKVKTVDGIAAPFLPQTPVGQAVWVQLRAIKGAGAPWLIQVPGTDCNLFDLPHIDPESLDPEVVPDPYWLTYMNTAIAEAIDGILDGAPAAMDTLAELAAALGDDPNFATTIITSLGEKVDQTTYDTAITAINTALGDKQPIATLAADVAPHVSDGSALDVALAAKIRKPLAGSVTYNGDGTVATSTLDSIVTTYTYNDDGTLDTEAREGQTITYAYTDGVLTGWSVA